MAEMANLFMQVSRGSDTFDGLRHEGEAEEVIVDWMRP